MDEVEREYERAIARASGQGDDDEAYSLSIGLRQYQEMFKDRPAEPGRKDRRWA